MFSCLNSEPKTAGQQKYVTIYRSKVHSHFSRWLRRLPGWNDQLSYTTCPTPTAERANPKQHECAAANASCISGTQ
jgi:hypothetical protein